MKLLINKLLALIFFSLSFLFLGPLISRNAYAATYYVDTSITDTNPSSATPDFTTYNPTTFETTGGTDSVYKSLADVNLKAFVSGDNIYFRRGQTWNEQLTISRSGSSGSPITFGAFGSGNKPIIDAQNTRSYAITTLVNFNYVTIQDIQIQNATFAGIWFDNSTTGLTLNNVTSEGGVRGIWIRKASSATYTNITANNSTTNCFYIGQLGTTVTVNGVSATGCSGYPAIYIYQLTDVNASNLTAVNNNNGGIQFLNNVGNITISDVTSGGNEANGNTGIGVKILGNVSANNVNYSLNNVISSYNSAQGFYLQLLRDGTVSVLVDNSLSEYNGDNGFELDTTKNITIQNTTSRLNGLNGIGTWYTANDNITITDCTIDGNLFDGISFHGSSSGVNINRCKSVNNGTVGSNNSGDGFTAHETVIMNIYNSLAYGNLNSGAAMINSATGEIINNTFFNNGSSGFNRAGFWSQVSGGAGWTIKNNIFSSNYPREIFTDTNGWSYATLDNNFYYHPSDQKLASIDNGITELAWDTYHTTNGYESNSNYGNPLFINTTTNNFQLERLSPAIDTGIDYSSTFTNDYINTLRPKNIVFDIGAYEYTPLTVIVNQKNDQDNQTSTSPINFTVVFSESVSDFVTGDVTVSGTAGATTATVSGSGTTYNVAVTGMTGSGTVIASIAVDKATGATSNTNDASTSTDNSVTYDISNPVISAILSTPTSTDSTITWTTDEDSSSKVDYGLTDSYGSSTTETDTSPRVSNHSVELTGLSACTTYHYRVRSIDALGNEGIGSDNTFITTGCSSSSNSSISSSSSSSSSAPSCDKTSPSSAPLLWGATSKGTNSILLQFGSAGNPVEHYALEFGTEPGKYIWGATTIGDKDTREYLVKSLSPNTRYYFRIRAGNGCASGNWSQEISATTWGYISTNDLLITGSELTPAKEEKPTQQNFCLAYTVKSGDSLWSIAQNELGDGNKYKDIIEQNKSLYTSLEKSNNLETGWELKMNCDKSNETQSESATPVDETEGYKVKVKVTDNNGQAVTGAKVTMHSIVQEATTNKEGIAEFNNVEPGDHRVIIAYGNYEGEQSLNLTGDVKEFALNVTVQEKPFSLSPLAIGLLSAMVLVIIVLLIKLKQHN